VFGFIIIQAFQVFFRFSAGERKLCIQLLYILGNIVDPRGVFWIFLVGAFKASHIIFVCHGV
jgi:hypothetical protein